jgi:tetratricopeptide (TPR) repeat protein
MNSETGIFVGRERELARLDTSLDEVLSGRGQVTLVTGEAGTGKTALVGEFARRAGEAHPELVVASGNCNAQTGSGDPYLPWREVMGLLTGDVEAKVAQGAISEDNADRLRGLLSWSWNAILEFGPDLVGIVVPGASAAAKVAKFVADQAGWLDKVEKLVERKAHQQTHGQPATAIGSGLEQGHIFQQYTNVLQALAGRQPLLLAVDDLQWADLASIGLLFHLSRRLSGHRILLVGTYRPDEVALGRSGERHPLDKVLAELKRYLGDIWVDLGDAAQAEGRSFVDALLDAEPNRLDWAFREALHRHTEGHPLFTVELLRDMRERGDLVQDDQRRWIEGRHLDWDMLPARVEGVIEERIDRLQVELRDALTVASVEGEEFTAEVIARVRNVDERGLVRQLSAELDRQHRLVRARGTERTGGQRLSRYRFRHNLFQDYLYESLDDIEREFMHEDVGNTLEGLYGEQCQEIAPQLARHFSEAGDRARALPYALEAGLRAQNSFAHEEAIHYLSMVLGMADELGEGVRRETVTALEHLGDIRVNLGQYDEAEEHYAAAMERMDSLPAGACGAERRASIYRKAGMVREGRGDYDGALAWLVRAREAVQDPGGAEMARVCLAMAGILHRQGQAEEALNWCQKGLEIALESGLDDDLAHAYLLRGLIRSRLGDLAEAIGDCRASLEIADRRGDLLRQAKAHNNLGINYHHQGDWQRAAEHYRQSMDIRERIGDVNGMATIANNLGELNLLQGRLEEAMSCFERCLTTWERTGYPLGVALAHRNLGQVCLRREEWSEAQEHLNRSWSILTEMGSRGWLLAEVNGHLAEVCLGLGQEESVSVPWTLPWNRRSRWWRAAPGACWAW